MAITYVNKQTLKRFIIQSEICLYFWGHAVNVHFYKEMHTPRVFITESMVYHRMLSIP